MPSKEEMLAALQRAIQKSTGGVQPDDSAPTMDRALPPRNPNDLNIVPPKPDPEAMANAQIARAASRDPGIPQPSANQLTPEQQAILMEHIHNVIASPQPAQKPLMQLLQSQAPAAPSYPTQEKPFNDGGDVSSQDLKKQYYQKKTQDTNEDEDNK